MSRRSARKNAFFLLFQMEFNHADEYEQVKEIFFSEKTEPLEEEDKMFLLTLVEGARANQAEIDLKIEQSAKGWNPDRMSKVDLAILRIAIYELCYFKETPVGVAINEAVELTKKFSSDEAPAFVNGILGKVIE